MATETAHPTPWTAHPDEDDDPDFMWTVTDANGGVVFFGMDRTVAQVFAAAPDLLAALKATLAKYTQLADSGDCGFWNSCEELHVIAARAAIAKAEAQP
jgi:hypothetical protein